jgi:hypothetical protein
MELLKIFQFKGLWQAGRKMAPEVGYFRRFTNTLIDRAGMIYGWGKGDNLGPNDATNLDEFYSNSLWYFPVNTALYKNNFLSVVLGRRNLVTPYFLSLRYADTSNTPKTIMQPYTSITGGSVFSLSAGTTNTLFEETTPSGNYSMAVVYNKQFIASCIDAQPTQEIPKYEDSFLVSFDGVRTSAAGLPKPWTIADPAGTPASHYIRTVYATIGLDGEPVFSDFLEQRLSSATRTVYLGGYTTFPTAPRADVISASRRKNDNLFDRELDPTYGLGAPKLRYYDTRFIRRNTISINATTGETTVTYSAISRPQSNPLGTTIKVGDWLYAILISGGAFIDQLQISTYLLAMQVKSVNTGTSTVVFENGIKFYSNDSLSWESTTMKVELDKMAAIDPDLSFQFQGLFAQIEGFSNIFNIVSYSASATAGYRVSKIYPNMHDSTVTLASQNLSALLTFPSPFMGVVTSFMADWYDTTVTRLEFPPVLGITNYKELLVGHDRNAIYFSDTTLGGSSGMVSGQSNFVPPGTEHGKITAVCGAEEFLYVSRERRSYVLRGDLVNGAFTIVECDYPIGGAVNTRACINAWGGKVLFFNAAGIFAVDSSGSIQDLSLSIQDLFLGKSVDQNLFDPTFIRTIDDIAAGPEDVIYKIALDEQRGLVLFNFARLGRDNDGLMIILESNCLAYDTRANAWSELATSGSTTIEAFTGKTFCFGLDMFKEDGALRTGEQQIVATQWLSLGEPSLQKQANQVKIYGSFNATTSGTRGVRISHQNDWVPFVGARVTNTTYTTSDATQYAHKKRLTASKPQAASIIFENFDTGSFKMEGIEVEGDQIQLGVKK